MQVTADTRNATAFELTALAELFAKLATVAPERVFAFATVGETSSVNDSPDNSSSNVDTAADAALNRGLGNVPAVPTDIPPVPANATASETPPPVPAAPSDTPATSANAVPAAPSDQKLDSAGFPWDARIHTANKATIGDNTWRKKPGVAPELIEQVRAEWTAAQGVPAAPNAAATGAIPAAPAADTAPVIPTLTGQDVLARCTEIQMSDMNKGAALFQAIVGAGIPTGPMGLMAVTDVAILTACLEAVNTVAAA